MKNRIEISCLRFFIQSFLFFISFFAFPQQLIQQNEQVQVSFRYKFNLNDKARILSTVEEDVYVQGRLSHHSKILNRITSVVTEVGEDGSGSTDAIFMTSEDALGSYGKSSGFLWSQEYKSSFTRSVLGKYSISDEYFMPSVRDVPVFPEEPVSLGQKWKAEGHEAHDLRMAFNIQKPFKVPFTATYCWSGTSQKEDGTLLYVIDAYYDLYFKSPLPGKYSVDYMNVPSVTKGRSVQKIYWDNQKGMIDHYNEQFQIEITTFSGQRYLFKGNAKAQVDEFERVSNDDNVSQIKQTVEEFGLKNVDVSKNEKGLVISLANIQFNPDSSELLESEKIKLQKIADILKKYSNDILVTGHCAKRGTVHFQNQISEDRAKAVASFLIDLGVRKRECIFATGKGSSVPIASNDTEEGRAQNRRVEIMLLDE